MPASRLSRILDKLDPENIARIVGATHDLARESFALPKVTVADHDEFHDVITRYYRHHYAKTISSSVVLPEDMVHAEVKMIVEQSHREYGGYEGAYRNARTGIAGGMHAILNALASTFKQRQEQQYIEHVFFTDVDPMDYDDIVALMQEYLDRFGFCLSPRDRARSPHDLARNYDEVIKAHVRHMSIIRGAMKRL